MFQRPDHGDGALAIVRNLRTAAEELEGGRERAVVTVQPHEQVYEITAGGVGGEVLTGGALLRGA